MNTPTNNQDSKFSNGASNSKNTSHKAPPRRSLDLPIIQKLVAAYKVWQEFFNHFPKVSRSLGFKINSLFLEIIELLFIASRLAGERKIEYLNRSLIKFDLLKFFIQISWETKILNDKKYILISQQLNEIGKMLGGWKKATENKTSATKAEEK